MFGAAAVGKVLQVNEHLRQSSHERSRVDRPEAELNASPTRTEGAATSQTSHGRMDLSLGRTSSAAVCRGRGTSAVGRRGRSKAMTKDAVWILWSGPSLSVSFSLPLHLPHCPPLLSHAVSDACKRSGRETKKKKYCTTRESLLKSKVNLGAAGDLFLHTLAILDGFILFFFFSFSGSIVFFAATSAIAAI